MKKYDINQRIIEELQLLHNTVYRSKGLETHMINRGHEDALKYLSELSDILMFPDYIGKNPNQNKESFECIKVLDENVLVAVGMDKKNDYYYVASVYLVKDAKLERMHERGRVKKFDKK